MERSQLRMGTMLTVHVEAESREAAVAASERAFQAVARAEARLSTWRDDTELARLNAAHPNRDVALSTELAADLELVRRCHELTKGAFDPTVGALVTAWDLRGAGRFPTAAELASARSRTGLDQFALAGSSARRLETGARLDAGGFGKGAGLDDAVVALASDPRVRSAFLDFGGQLVSYRRDAGDPSQIGPFQIDIAHPDHRDRTVASLSLPAGSVATTGNGERGLVVDGLEVGHVLDPRTGRPAADFGSLTVWVDSALDRSATLADCLSTGLYVLGPNAALDFASRHDGIEVVVATRTDTDLQIHASSGLSSRVAGPNSDFAAAPAPGAAQTTWDDEPNAATHGSSPH